MNKQYKTVDNSYVLLYSVYIENAWIDKSACIDKVLVSIKALA